MIDDPTKSSGQPAGTGEGESPAPESGAELTGQKEAEGKYLTRAEAAALEERLLNQSRSYADKGRVRLQKELDSVSAYIEQAKILGKEVSPAEQKTLRDAAVQRSLIDAEPPTEPQTPGAQPQVQLDPEIARIENTVGVHLYDGDPELSKIDRTQGLTEFYTSVKAAAAAKKARLSSSNPEPSSPSSRVPAEGTPSSGIPVDMSANEAWQRVRHKK